MQRSLIDMDSGLLDTTNSPSWGFLGGPSRFVVAGAGSSKSRELHDKSDYGDDLANLEAKSRTDLLEQKMMYEKLLSEFKLNQAASFDSVVRAHSDTQQKNLLELLKAKNYSLNQQAAYELSLTKLKLKVNELEADNDKQLNKLRFLEAKGYDNLLQQKLEQKTPYEQVLSRLELRVNKLEADNRENSDNWLYLSVICVVLIPVAVLRAIVRS